MRLSILYDPWWFLQHLCFIPACSTVFIFTYHCSEARKCSCEFVILSASEFVSLFSSFIVNIHELHRNREGKEGVVYIYFWHIANLSATAIVVDCYLFHYTHYGACYHCSMHIAGPILHVFSHIAGPNGNGNNIFLVVLMKTLWCGQVLRFIS